MVDYRPDSGYIEMIVGPMFSGKSEDLIKNINTFIIAKKKVLIFKPKKDSRSGYTEIKSRNGKKIRAYPIKNSKEIYEIIEKQEEKPTVVAIDEVQFFDEGLIEVSEKLADDGIKVLLAGLDMDFRGEPFPTVAKLMARAEIVNKLKAVCTICAQPATRSQRIIEGKPAHYDSPTIQVGDSDIYEARCRMHHYVPKD